MSDGGRARKDSVARRSRGPARRPRRRHTRRAVVVVVCLLVAAVVGVPITHLVAQIDRIPDAFTGLEDRPAESGQSSDSLDVLVVGMNAPASSEATTWLPEDRRPLNVMVMHLDPARRAPTVVGIPADVRVEVPGGGHSTLGSVAQRQEPSELIATVEGLTGFRMDHLAVLDWKAFKTLTDRMGGIDLRVGGSTAAGPVGGYRMQITGQEALEAVSPQPGVDSMALLSRQMMLMDAVVDGSLHGGLKSPLLVYNFLDAVTGNLSVDEGWSIASMTRLFFGVWTLPSGAIRYVTLPVDCVRVKNLCRPKLDRRAAADFWSAVENDQISDWLAENHGRGLVNTLD